MLRAIVETLDGPLEYFVSEPLPEQIYIPVKKKISLIQPDPSEAPTVSIEKARYELQETWDLYPSGVTRVPRYVRAE